MFGYWIAAIVLLSAVCYVVYDYLRDEYLDVKITAARNKMHRSAICINELKFEEHKKFEAHTQMFIEQLQVDIMILKSKIDSLEERSRKNEA